MKKIALIEDDRFILDFVSNQLAQSGYQVSGCADGEKAVEHIKLEKPDLVLLDLDLPHVNGRAILDQLKSDQDLKDTPVVIFSNNNDPDLVKTLLAAGADDFYLKAATDPEELVALIVKHL